MTATYPTRSGPPRTGGPSRASVSLLREFRLYRFYDDAGRLLYVGMTGRMSLERLIEHIKTKPWAKDVACWERDPRSWDNEAECLAAERAAINAERPIHNIAHNGNNPGPVAVRQRPTRPAPPPPPSLWARFWATRAGRALAAWLRRAAIVTAAWAALTAALTVTLWRLADLDLETSAGSAAFAATAAMVKWWPRRRTRRRRR